MNYTETNKKVKEFIDSVVGREFTFMEFDEMMVEQGFESIAPKNINRFKGVDGFNFKVETRDNTMIYKMPESVYKDNMYDFETTFPIKVVMQFEIVKGISRSRLDTWWDATISINYMTTIY